MASWKVHLSDQPAATQLYLMSPQEMQAQMCQEMLLICIYVKSPDLKILATNREVFFLTQSIIKSYDSYY